MKMATSINGLYADRMALYQRFMKQEMDRESYMAQLAWYDAQIDRLELSVLRSCEIYQRVCAITDPTLESNKDQRDRS